MNKCFAIYFQSLLLALLLVLFPCQLSAQWDKATLSMLEELDQYISVRQTYDVNKRVRIDMLIQMSMDRYTSSNQLYSIYSSLADEYYTCSFDSTIVYIRKCRTLGTKQGDKKLVDQARIKMGLVYTTAGHYLEASNLLVESLDPKQLDPSLLPDYYTAMYRLVSDLGDFVPYTDALADRDYWVKANRAALYLLLDSTSIQYMSLKVDELRDEGRYETADSVNRIILSRIQIGSHEYAKASYVESLIRNDLHDSQGRLEWLIRAAKADIQNGVKDYAALTTIANILFDNGDIDRAFQYEQVCMWDAMYYNARLRQWQVAASIPVIEKAYQDKQKMQQKKMSIYMVVISIMAVVLCAALVLIVSRSRKLSRTQKDLQKMNDIYAASNRELETANGRLSELNKEISEANTVKEEYIGLFLGILSDNIDKMKDYESMVRKKIKYGRVDELAEELSRSNLVEHEMAAFYQTFDNAFLTLYPNFVDEFNSLLEDEGKIVPKKGEMLNTELRIFALIRLGIDDSSKIAALLRYSVNTIYNYRAKVKNSAKVSREQFEDIIKTIGEISNY